MSNDFELLKNVGAIYRCAFFNLAMHPNTMRNKLIFQRKISTKNKFYQAFDKIVAEGGIIKSKDVVSINPEVVLKGVFREENGNYYVAMVGGDEVYRISKGVAQSYENGDALHVVLTEIGGQREAIVLGKNYEESFTDYTDRRAKEKKEKAEAVGADCVIGRVVKLSHDDLVFIPNDKKLARQIPIINAKSEMAGFQDKICVMKLQNPDDVTFGGTIIETRGDAGNPVHEYAAIAEDHDAIMNWEGAQIEEEISKIPTSVDLSTLSLITEEEARKNPQGKTVDLRHLPFTTVDPATCKDMDDAIYSYIDEKGHIVCYTAVANVTKYVNLDSEIGRRYTQSAFTIYAPNRAYNILPTGLSTGICSLNENEDRLAFVVKTVLDQRTGNPIRSEIFDALISSRKKYSYEQAQEIVDERRLEYTYGYLKSKLQAGEQLTLEEQVMMNYHAANVIKRGFRDRNMITFNTKSERTVTFNEDQSDIIDIIPENHLYYHEVIEAFMITANEATAKYCLDHKIDNIYRTHEEPSDKKKERAFELFSVLGIEFDGDLSPMGLKKIVEEVEGRDVEEIVNKFLVRLQSRAMYNIDLGDEDGEDTYYYDNNGKIVIDDEFISHFGLQSKHYSHTTSPIRRSPDYVTHYNILAHIHGSQPLTSKRVYEIASIANQRQTEVDEAERQFEDLNSAIYCEKHIGDQFDGRIVKFKKTTEDQGFVDEILVVVKAEENGVEAIIPLSEIIGGKKAASAYISKYGSHITDALGNPLLTLCQPVSFKIERADRRTREVVGGVDRQNFARSESEMPYAHGRQKWGREQAQNPAFANARIKSSRENRRRNNKAKNKRNGDLEKDF